MLFIPLFGMFIAPIVLYDSKISINLDTSIYTFDYTQKSIGILLVLLWILLVYGGIFLLKNFFREGSARPRIFIYIFKNYYYIAALFMFSFVVHMLFIMPTFLENIFHIFVMQIYPILGVGIYYINNLKIDKNFKLINIIFWILLIFIPLLLGNITYMIYGASALIMNLIFFRFSYKKIITITFFLILLISIVIPFKNLIRVILYDGVFTRTHIFNIYENHDENLKLRNSNDIELIYKKLSQIKSFNNLLPIINEEMESFRTYDRNYESLVVKSGFNYFDYTLARIVHRINHMSMFLYVIEMTPSKIPYWEVGVWQVVATSAIPRFLWSNKPHVGHSNEFGRRYSFIASDDYLTTVNIDPLTNSWVTGGFKSFILNALVLGVFFGLVFSWVKSKGNFEFKYFFTVFLGIHLITFESEIVLTISGLVQFLLVISILILLKRVFRYSR